jgi:hypothetical protein
MSQNYKNDDLGYMSRKNQIKKTIAENIPNNIYTMDDKLLINKIMLIINTL